MRVFNCDHCGHLVFFDSVTCLHCGSTLAFLPDVLTLAALEPAHDIGPDLWRRRVGGPGSTAAMAPAGAAPLYRMCRNHTEHQACNFAVPMAIGPQALCASCCQTRVLPDLSDAANLRRWKQIEAAKRQLFYTLARLGLEPAPGRWGPVFEFLADQPGSPVITGHQGGTITLNVAEADDDERARRRMVLGEPYRTLIGHLRHESGHFYWDQLVRDAGNTEAFRAVFGDEQQDYTAALGSYYARSGDLGDWSARHVSAYATAHPWEDWAETWAHYLHLIDLLETAASYQAAITVPDPHNPVRHHVTDPFADPRPGFQDMVRQWVPLTLLLNSLNRSLGQDDAYPFALQSDAMAKLRFVHDLVRASAQAAFAPLHAPAP